MKVKHIIEERRRRFSVYANQHMTRSKKKTSDSFNDEQWGDIIRDAAGIDALLSWTHILSENLSDPLCEQLAQAALALVKHKETRAALLQDLISLAVSEHKPYLFTFTKKAYQLDLDLTKDLSSVNLLDIEKPSHDHAKYWEASYLLSQHKSWLRQAIDRRSWECVSLFVGDPLTDDGPFPAFCDNFTQKNGEVDDDILTSISFSNQINQANLLEHQDPSLGLWCLDLNSNEKTPKHIATLLSEAGHIPRPDDPSFCLAACSLALQGSSGAQQWCLEHHISPRALLTHKEYKDDSWSPLYLKAAVFSFSDSESKANWKSIKKWLTATDKSLNDLVEEDACFFLLKKWEESHFHFYNHNGCSSKAIFNALTQLADRGSLDPETQQVKADFLQNLTLNLLDKKGSSSDFVSELKNVLHLFSSTPTQKKKILKV